MRLAQLAGGGVAAGPLGFDEGEGFAVVAPEDVIDVAGAGGVGHAGDFEFAVAWLI